MQSQYELRHITTEITGLDNNRAEGYAIVYDKPSVEMNFPSTGAFREIIKPGAATEALKGADIPALYAHDTKHILGRTSKGTLTLKEDGNGVWASLDLPKTNLGIDLRESIKRGDVNGWSFYLKVPKGGDSWEKTPEGRIRTVNKMGIGEITLTGFAAYPDTTLALRSYEEWEQEHNLLVPIDVRLKQIQLIQMG